MTAILKIVILGMGSLSFTTGTIAQNYPTKPVRMIIPISPGSGTDIVGRLVGQRLSPLWGQPVIVENRPGAGGALGAGIAAKAAPDGYTLLVNSVGAHVASAALNPKLPYDALKDLIPLAPLVSLPQVLVIAPSGGVKSVSELIALAKAKPGQLNFASPGVGSGVHFTGERFRLAAGIDVVHVPYKGGPEAMNDVMMGRATYWIPSLGTALPLIQAGKLLALGVTSRQRSTALPAVPTIAEAGVRGFEDAILFGIWVPSGLPSDIFSKLSKDIAQICASVEMRDQFQKLAGEPVTMTPAEFSKVVRADFDAVSKVVKATGLKLE
jgi:tripartite-type tricarboxylate transporter receptor subunit TctC